MNKMLAVTLCLFSLGVQAGEDSDYDFFIGATGWYTAANGSINAPGYTLTLEESDIEKRYNSVLFATFEHPVTSLPDILISRNNIQHDGTGVLTTFSTFPVEGTIELTHIDITLYYNVLDGIGFLDLGATARIFNGELYVNILPSGPSGLSDLSTTLGLVYLKTGINMPLQGLSMGLALNGGDRGNDQSADASLYINYESPDGLGAIYGYRYFNTEIYSEGKLGPITVDIAADFNVFGPYISIYYHF